MRCCCIILICSGMFLGRIGWMADPFMIGLRTICYFSSSRTPLSSRCCPNSLRQLPSPCILRMLVRGVCSIASASGCCYEHRARTNSSFGISWRTTIILPTMEVKVPFRKRFRTGNHCTISACAWRTVSMQTCSAEIILDWINWNSSFVCWTGVEYVLDSPWLDCRRWIVTSHSGWSKCIIGSLLRSDVDRVWI